MARQMKDSGIEWIDSIPINWETIKLCYVTDTIFLGKTPIYFEGENENYTLGQKNNQQYGLDFAGIKYSTDEHFASCTENEFLQYGDILLNSLGTGSVGRIGYFDVTDKKVLTDGHIIVIRGNEQIDTRFLFYYLRTLRTKFEDDAVGSTNQAFLTVPKIYKTPVPFPPLSEQHRIADFLDRHCAEIDAVIERTKATIEEYKKLKQAVITEAVTKGVRGPRPMKDSGIEWIKQIPEGWENRKMISILAMRVIDGPHESPELFDTGVPYISANAIDNGRIDFAKMRGYISEEYCDLCDKRYKPQRDDLLVIKLGATTGQVALVDTDERFNIWVPLAALRCNDLATPRFVYYAMQSDYYLRQMERSWTFGTQQTLGVKTIERLRILLPAIAEQQEIVDYLKSRCEQLDTLITKKTALLTELETYKKSLIYEYVTGKKEV